MTIDDPLPLPKKNAPPRFGSELIDPWLDNFLLNCIGTEMLMSQYLACVNMASGSSLAGIVDPDCDIAQICRETAMHVQDITEEHTGRTPKIEAGLGKVFNMVKLLYLTLFLHVSSPQKKLTESEW